MAWDPRQYLKFSGERLRPGFDLMAQCGELPPGPLFELGCGTGVHARAIAERWPDRSLTALDNSAPMLAEAAATPSAIHWQEADIASWSAPEAAALIYSNATLHWLGDHARLFPHLMRQLAPAGVLAVQMPRNFAAPSHALLRETAQAGPWAARFTAAADRDDGIRAMLGPDPVSAPEVYYDLLKPLAADGVDLWETVYIHQLSGEDPVLEWMRGSSLRPLLSALPSELAAQFEATLAATLRAAYPCRADGRTLLPFRRLFLVARA